MGFWGVFLYLLKSFCKDANIEALGLSVWLCEGFMGNWWAWVVVWLPKGLVGDFGGVLEGGLSKRRRLSLSPL